MKFVVPDFKTFGEEKLVLTQAESGVLVWWQGMLVANLSNREEAVILTPNELNGDKFVSEVSGEKLDEKLRISVFSRIELITGFWLSMINDSRAEPYFSILVDWTRT